MKETEITCLCRSIRIPDLGLSLFKGQVEYVDAHKASQSQDLAQARRVGGVAVREVQRVRKRRSPKEMSPRPTGPVRSNRQRGAGAVPEHTLGPKSGKQASASHPARRQRQPLVVQAEVDLDGVRQVVREEVTGALRDAILSMGLPKEPIRGSKVPDSVGVSQGMPAFIPSRIVNSDVKAEVQVESEELGSGEVDAAAKALKARKKPAPKRAPRKKRTEK